MADLVDTNNPSERQLQFRKEYQALVRAHLDALQQRFSANRIDYTVLDTSKPLDHALYRYLSSRARMMKVR